MALAVVTVRPNSTSQMGLPTNTVVGAASANAALADSSDTSYVQLTALARLDSEVIRVGFPTPSLPAGAKVLSVGLRRRIQTVVVTDPINQPPPVTHTWLRCLLGLIEVVGQAQQPKKSIVSRSCPTSTVTSQWIEEDLGSVPPPAGAVWDPATTLSNVTLDIGRDAAVQTLRVSAVYLDVTYQQQSAVIATGPTGTSTATSPTVTWTYSSPDSQPQQAYRVAVYTAAQIAQGGFTPFVTTPIQASNWTPGASWSPSSGWLLGEDLQWTLTSDLTDGAYTAYVQAQPRWSGGGDFPTAVSSTSWTRAAAVSPPPLQNPPPPAVLLAATFDTTNSRVALTFQPGGASPATTAFTAQASRDNGVTWVDIPRLAYRPANGSAAVTDYDYNFFEFNVETRYRVVAYTGTPRVAATTPSNVLSVTPAGDQHLLKHPSNPLLNTVLPVAAPKPGDGIKITERQVQGTFQPVGGAGSTVLPITVSGPNSGLEYELEALFIRGEPSFAYYQPVVQLQRSGSVLLWQRPDGNLWIKLGPGVSGRDTEETYDAIPGDPRKVAWRRRKLTLTEQDPPDYY
jgi:hypothetical protein